MTLITNTEEIKAANSAVVYDLNFESIISYVHEASNKDIVPAIGRSTYLIIGSPGEVNAMIIANELAKRAEANLAVAYYTNFGSVKLGENGAAVYQDDKYRIASDKKIAALINQSLLDGHRALDQLLAHLEINLTAFTEYQNSQERKANRSLFINSTAEFNKAVFIDDNALLFRSLKSYLRDAEIEHIEPILGDDYTAELRLAVLDNTCTPVQKQLLDHIARVEAQFAIAEAIPYNMIGLSTKGVFTNPDSEREPDTHRLTMAMATALSRGNENKARLRRFISKNKDALAGCNTVTLDIRSQLNDTDRGFYFI